MISAPFSLLQLPQISVDSERKTQVVVDGVNAYLGVSNSSIAALSLSPPQELDAFSVSPGTQITALCVVDAEQIFYATKERTKYFLKTTNGQAISIASQAAYIYATKETIIVIYSNLSIETYSHDLEFKWSTKEIGSKKESVTYSALVNDNTFFLITSKDSIYNLVILSFSSTTCAQLQRIELPNRASPKNLWSYSEGTLFWGTSSTIILYNVQSVTEIAQIPVSSDDLLGISSSLCLVVKENKLIVLDSQFQAELAYYSVESKFNLLAYVKDASCVLTLDSEDNLVGFPLKSTSQGSLLESIGRGISSPTQFKYGYTDIFNFSGPVKEIKKVAVQRIDEAQASAAEILNHLNSDFRKKDGEAFSRVLQYCKGTDWNECKPQLDAVTYEESDRRVDKDFVKAIVEFAFGSAKPFTYSDFLPETVGIYLLTHPLFPTNAPEYRGIFTALESNPLLYRQAVVTLKGANAKNIIEALSSPSEEIFSDAVTRLNAEFSHEQIASGIKVAFSRSSHVQVSSISKLVTRLSQHSEGWTLIAPLIDVIGLHSWSIELINSLKTRLNRQIEHVKGLQSVGLTTAELLRSVDIDITGESSLISRTELKRKSRKGQKNDRKDEGFKDIPRYSVETLVFTEH